MNVRPLYDRIIVKRSEEEESIRNGIFIPDSAKEKPQEGEVVAVGRGRRLDDGQIVPLDVKTGDRVLFGKYTGSETKVDGAEYTDHARRRCFSNSRLSFSRTAKAS